MMGEGAAEGGQCDGERVVVAGLEWSEVKVDGCDAMMEEADLQQMQVDEKERAGSETDTSSCDTIEVLGEACAMGTREQIRAGIVSGDDDQIESSLVSEFEVQNAGMGSSSQLGSEADVEESYSHLFTDAMKLQLRAQILVLGDFLKGIAPSPDWLEEACLEPVIGADFGLPEPMDAPRGIPAESNLQRILPASQNAGARISPSSESAGPPTTPAAGRLSNPGEPSSSGKEFLYRDDSFAQETDAGPLGQLTIAYDHTTTARMNSNVAEDNSQGTDTRAHDNDMHLDLAQASAQDALTTATSALAQSHMVWARLHSRNHSEEGLARDARIASVAATVAAASSVAKAAVEAARAIAEVSVDAFIQAGGYQLGDTSLAQLGSTRLRPLQVPGLDQSPRSNTRGNTSQHRSDMVESVVQAAGKAAEAATQAGVVLAKANPLMQISGLSEFWSRKLNEADAEHEGNEYGGMNEGHGMDAAIGEDGGRKGDALNEFDAVNEVDELDERNEEDAVEEMEDTQEEEIASQDKLDVANGMGDLHSGGIANLDVAEEDDVAAANGNEGGVAAAIEAEAFVANGVAMVELNGDEDVEANEDEVFPVDEVAEQEKSLRSRKSKRGQGRGRGRGRGRFQGVSSRAKRYKNSLGASSAILPSQIPENELPREDEPGSPENARDGDARSEERGADYVENVTMSTSGKDTPTIAPAEPAGKDTPASATGQIPENEMQRQDDIPESPKIVGGGRGRGRGKGRGRGRGRFQGVSSRAKSHKNSLGASSAVIPSQTPENELHREDEPGSPKNARDGEARSEERGADYMENVTMSTSGKDTPAIAPAETAGEDTPASAAGQIPENEMQRQDNVPESPKIVRGGNARGKKRGAKQMGRTFVSTSGKDIPSTAPAQPSEEERPSPAAAHATENEMQEKDGVPENSTIVRGGNARGKKRGAKQMENTLGKDKPASAAAHTTENEMQGKYDTPDSQKTVRGGNARGKKRGTKQMEKTPVSSSGNDIPSANPVQHSGEDRTALAAAQIPEKEMQREDDVLESPKKVSVGNARGKKRRAKQMEKTPVSISDNDIPSVAPGEDTLASAAAQIPEKEMQREEDVLEIPKVRGGNARGKKRGAKQMDKTPVSTSGEDTAEQGLREPESDRNTRDFPENTVEGSAVEVMTDEVGLRGGWFSGTVLRMTPNEAFVELHELLTDDGKANVREWFPLVEGFNPYRPRRHVRPVHPFSIFTEAGSRKRRRVALGSQTWHIGDHVDAFFQDVWWEGIVAELNELDPSKATIYFPEENDTQVIKTWDLRPSFQWKDNKWMPWKNPVLVEDERPHKRQRIGGPIKKATTGGPDNLISQESNGKSSERRKLRAKMPEDSRIVPEPISARKRSPIKMLQESKISHKRVRRTKVSFKRLKSESKNASHKQKGLSTINGRKAQQKGALSPGTSKKLDFTMDTIASRASASKANATRSKVKPKLWRKKDT